MKIFFLTVDRSNRVATHFENFQNGLEKEAKFSGEVVEIFRRTLTLPAHQHCFRVVGDGKNDDFLTSSDVERINSEFDTVITDAPFAFMGKKWKDIKISKGVIFEDSHGPLIEKMVNNFKEMGTTFFCYRYKYYFLEKFEKQLRGIEKLWLPHSMNLSYFNEEVPKERKVSLFGMSNYQTYPIRQKILDSCRKKDWFVRIERPKEDSDNRWPIKEDYFRFLKSFKISATCGSIYNYPIMKFFEIPSMETVLVSNYFYELSELGFQPGLNFYELDMQNIPEQMEFLLSFDCSGVIEKGKELIQRRHTVRKRSKELLNFLEGLQ